MSLALAAKHLESHGRGNDSHLVHMSADELRSLQSLAMSHGGSLTINPKTGLPEAGFLSSILPMVAGVALTGLSGGAINPLMAAGIVGGGTALLSGDLSKGLMAGLGAWSGASLQADLANIAPGAQVGTNTAEQLAQSQQARALETAGQADILGATAPVNATVNTTGYSSSLLSPGATGQTAAGSNIASQGLNAGVNAGVNTGLNQNFGALANTTQGPGVNIGQFGTGAATQAASVAPGSLEASWQGAKELWNNPAARKPFWEANKWDIIGTAMPIARGIGEEMRPEYKAPEKEENPMNLKYLSKDFKGSDPRQPKPYYTAQYRDYVTNPYMPSYYKSADGGLQSINKYAGEGESYVRLANQLLQQPRVKPADITPTDPGAAYSPLYNSIGIVPYEKGTESHSSDKMAKDLLKYAKSLGKIAASTMINQQDPATTAMASIANETPASSAKEGGLQGYALGGLSMGHLGGYSDGGRLLKGPGDGVSDSIPASIGSKQPARLAEGEFVIPARIVSELGNGSTDAGAKRLYAMMDRIKAKRAKTKNIAADSKAYKLLPA